LSEAKEEGEIAVDTVVAFKLAGSLDTLPCGCDLDEDTVLLDANRLVKSNELLGLTITVIFNYMTMLSLGQTLALVASLSKERRASTSVETRPGMMARISFPNSTS